jgi:6-phosphogluconolactonase (cycloisomerase 2 family)
VSDERLVVVSGAAAGSAFEVADELVVGRGETGPGSLHGDPELSDRHARIHRIESGRLLVEDLGSAGGTLVNGRAITGPRLLRSGDEVQLGATVLRYGAGAPRRPPAPVAAPAAAEPPPRAPAVARDRPRRPDRAAVGLIAVLLIAVALVGGIAIGHRGGGGSAASPSADEPGVAGTVYIESNRSARNANSVLAYQYRTDGRLNPLHIAEYPTGGSGSTDLSDSGVLDADQHVLYSPEKHLLFAVNQGSDSVAVFHVRRDGSLTAVAGSPFPSRGKAPASVGLSGDNVVVVNKAQDGIRKLKTVAPNYTVFRLHDDGSLTPTGSVVDAPPGNSPTQALVSTDGKVVMTSEESGPFRAFTLSRDGRLQEGPNSPLSAPASIYKPGFPQTKRWGLGLAVHPTQQVMYAQMVTINAMAVFRYDDDGRLTFVRAVDEPGAELPCWTIISRDGSRVYAEDAGNNTISVFDTSDPVKPRRIQLVHLHHAGNPWDAHLDPTGRYFFMIDPRTRLNVSVGEGQEIHVLLVGPDGTLSEPADSTAPIPVSDTTQPFGLTVAARY